MYKREIEDSYKLYPKGYRSRKKIDPRKINLKSGAESGTMVLLFCKSVEKSPIESISIAE